MSDHDTQTTQANLAASLRAYLPLPLARQCLVEGEIVDPGTCVQHLAALLRAITTYLPRQVVDPLLARPVRGQVEGRFEHGTVMFSDISGFTAMSERLSRLGKEGAEEITAIVNRFFAALLQVTGRYGGDLLKFGGDALLLFFGGHDHALRACQAALKMQDTMSGFAETVTSQGAFRLRMTIGLGTGPLFMAHLGSGDNGTGSMEFAVMGQAMATMAQAEDQASAGEIFIDAATHKALAGQGITTDERDGFRRLLALDPGVSGDEIAPDFLASDPPQVIDALGIDETLLAQAQKLVQRIQALGLFLAPGMMDKIKLDPERIAIGGEYRLVTVLFVNFYGIEEIIQELGPARSAEITAILNAHFKTMRQIIAKYDGVVNKVDSYAVGHRIMALFGAPRAHIDDPERAVRAALEMQEAMIAFADLETSCGLFCLKQRIGVNTGLVFAGNVGSLTRQEYSVMGDEVNLTARLMAVAGEGQVIISESTARQSGGCFVLHEQAPVRVKGKSMPIHNYEALGIKESQDRQQVGREQRPMVGRAKEWETIHALADRAAAGEPLVVTVIGDVGLGKSRLIQEIAEHWAQEHQRRCISTQCPSFGRHTPYLPWLEVLRDLFEIAPTESRQAKMVKVDALLRQVDPGLGDWATLIGRLIGLDVQESTLVQALDAQTRKQTISYAVTKLIDYVAAERPLLLAFDDLQWADEATVELINQVIRRVNNRPLLWLIAHRPEESLALNVSEASLKIRLSELSDEASLQLLDTLLPTTPQMPQHLKELILNKARGNPLFIDAVAHSLIENYLVLDHETGTYHARTDLAGIEVPDSVNRVIMSRIDRLDESSRNVLRVASVIGQEFEHWLLSAIYPYRQTEGELRERLDELAEREILSGPLNDLLYLFRHILTREVAYESLLYADRRQLHRRIGTSIEVQRAGQLAEYWEVLAYHFRLAEEWDKALRYHLEAGRKAQSIYANEDAIHHFRQALRAAEQVPDSREWQLDAHQRLVQVLDTIGEYDQALARNYQVLRLVTEIDIPEQERGRQLADLCCKAAAIYEKKSNYDAAFSWLQGALSALEDQEPLEKAHTYLLGAGIYQRQGKTSEAIEWCQKGLSVAEKIGDREAQPVIAHAHYLLGLIYCRAGDTARTIQVCQTSVEIYEQIGNLLGASQAHNNLANAYFDRGSQGDWQRGTRHYLQSLDIKRRIGDVYGQAMITLNLGQAYLDQGDLGQASAYNQQSLSMWEELGSMYAIALMHNNMGTVALHQQDLPGSLAHLEKSLALFQQIGSGDFLPEVYRHFAEIYTAMGESDKAAEWAQRSLEQAREQEMFLEEGASHRALGQVYLARGEIDRAEHELQESHRVLQTLNSRYEIGKTLYEIARLRHLQGDPIQKHQALAQAKAIFEDLGAQLNLAKAQALESQAPNP